jgi:hypothetical protein
MKIGVGTIWKKTSHVTVLRLPKRLTDDPDFSFEHGDKVTIILEHSGNMKVSKKYKK